MIPENNKMAEPNADIEPKKQTDAELISQGAEGKDENIIAAHDEAEKDIDSDPDFDLPTPNDDLDEGETALLGDDKTDLI